MAYDEGLAQRIRELLEGDAASEKRMFGGLCFLWSGNMCCGVLQKKLMLRLGPKGAQQALSEPHTGRCNRVDMWRRNLRVALTAEFAVAQIVRDQQDNVRWPVLC